ncbi:MAG: flagellar hook-basal body complex protein [Solirubrobacteraceae bacterium]|nr:flagellar hook-basal body complex protein [Patulibacter sp.]
MFTAQSGLMSHQILLDVTSNNLANVNTIGYKASRTTFQDSLTQLQQTGGASSPGFGGSNAKQIGLGVTVGSIGNLMGAGSFQVTGSSLDVAIQGDGWLRVANGTPTSGNPTAGTPTGAAMNYTRAGNFTQNDKGYLITTDGYYVVGKVAPDTAASGSVADCYIQIPDGASNVAIAPTAR